MLHPDEDVRTYKIRYKYKLLQIPILKGFTGKCESVNIKPVLYAINLQ